MLRTMSSVSRFVISRCHILELSCGSTVIWHIDYVPLRVRLSACAFSSTHMYTYMLIYEIAYEYNAMQMCVCFSVVSF